MALEELEEESGAGGSTSESVGGRCKRGGIRGLDSEPPDGEKHEQGDD